jgi:hypothetical protein
MKYNDGRPVAVGDRVKLGGKLRGVVVCSIDSKEFSPDFPEGDWGYLESGVIIQTTTGDIFHYTEPDEDFALIKSVAAP